MKLKSLLFVLAVLILSSCGSKKSELIEMIGADAEIAGLLHPEKILKESGVKDLSAVAAAIGHYSAMDLDSYIQLEGLDRDNIAVVKYKKTPGVLCMVAVSNAGDFEKSIAKAGFTTADAAGRTVYISPDGLKMLVEGNILFGGSSNSEADFVKAVDEAISAAANPLPEWKSKELTSSHAATAIAGAGKHVAVASFDISKKSITFDSHTYDAMGNPAPLYEQVEITPLGGDTDYLDSKALFSMAIGATNYADLLGAAPATEMLGAGEAVATGFLKSVKGPIKLSLAFDGDDLYKMHEYALNLSLVATDKKAASEIVASALLVAKGLGLYVKNEKNGFTTRFEGVEMTIEAKNDLVTVKTDHQIDGKRPSGSEVKGNAVWMSANLPKKLCKLASDKANFGLEVTVSSTSTGAKGEITLTETDLTMGEVIAGMLQ